MSAQSQAKNVDDVMGVQVQCCCNLEVDAARAVQAPASSMQQMGMGMHQGATPVIGQPVMGQPDYRTVQRQRNSLVLLLHY